MTARSPLVGIDLGTTHSLCAVFRDGRPELVPNAHGSVLTPSVVGLSDDGAILVGQAAREMALTRPERTAATFKRWMGERREVRLGDRGFTPPELSSLVLRSLKADAEARLGTEVTEAVITVPAYFNELQRRATRSAGEMAGLTVRRVVNEPTAAALAYGFHRMRESAHLLVFDLGGGTFDVTVMEIFEGTLEILATAGESRLGGEDFTDTLVAWALERTGRLLETAEMNAPRLVSRLRAEAEAAKRSLGESDSARLRLPDAEGNVGPDAEVLEIPAALFEERTSALLARLRKPVEQALRDARKGFQAIDEVLLVGGATRMPIVRRLVSDLFGREARVDVDPDVVVAQGAAIQAALILDDAAVEDLVMTDVCPFTLGVEVTKFFGQRHVEGYFAPVIHRNTTIPVSREELFSTVRPHQTELLLRVFQGEGRRVEENLLLGELRVTGLPPQQQPLDVAVRFTYDLNGLLEVEAWVPATGAKSSTVLRHELSGLGEDELSAAVSAMQALKFYPREKLENRRLLHFAEGVVGEVDRFQRGGLEELLDAFERALDAGDAAVFEVARNELLMRLEVLGFPYVESRAEGGDD